VHTEFVTDGRPTIAASDVHGSYAPNAGPIGFGAEDGSGDGDAVGMDTGWASAPFERLRVTLAVRMTAATARRIT
jgi:hypothetical protein